MRITLALLELPFEMKRLIADEVIAATLALKLYNEHGPKSLEYVKEALAAKELEEPVDSLELALNEITQGLETSEAPAPAPVEGGGAEPAETAPIQAQQAPVKPPRKVKVTGKDVDKLVQRAPKISKKTVQFVHQSFQTLGQRIDAMKLQGDRFVMEMSAEEADLLKQIRVQLAAASQPETEQKDPAQTDLLEQQNMEGASSERPASATLQ
ncbi:hypothetical protein D3C77_447030 [compost metagenome]